MAEIIRIPDGNAFLLRVTGQIRTGDYTEIADFSVVTHMGVNFVRRGRIAQTFGLDSLGRIVIENSGNLAQGVYGVELYGYYHGEPWRNYQKNVFQIVNENANSDPGSDNENELTYDVTFDVTFGGDGISAAFVDATVATHNSNQESHPDLREEIEEKVSDVKVGDTSVVEGGVAVIDLSGKQDVIDDLSSIRSGATAGGTAYQKPGTGIPESDMSDAVKAKLAKAETALQEHQDISGKQDVIQDLSTIRSGAAAGGTAYQKPGTGIPSSDLSAEVQDMIENGGKTKSVSVNGGTPVTPDANGQVDLTIEQANITIGNVTTGEEGSNADVTNSGTPTAPVLNFKIPRGNTGGQGQKGPQGDSVIVGEGDLPLAHVTGQSTEKAMSQKGVTDELLDAEAGEYKSVTLSRLKQYRNYISGGVWKTASNDNNLCSFLPVTPGQIIKTYTELTSHHVIFLASGEPGASDSTPAYAGGVTEMPGWNNSPGSVFYYKVPDDATYLYIRLKDGGNVKTPTVWVAEVLPETTKRLDKAEEDILDARAYSFKEQNLSNLDLVEKYISGNAWASGSENNCCVFLPVTAGNIMRTKSVDSTHHVIFLTSGTSGSVGSLPDYAGGLICQPEYNSAGVWHYYVVPSDATYLYVRTKISGVDRTPLIEVAQTVNDTISDVKDNLATLLSSLIKAEVDTSNLTVYNSYISGYGVWVGGSAANNNCIFVPVEPGRKYFVGRDDGLQWHAFFLKNDSIVNAAAPAYAGGITTKPEWFNGMKIMTAPADARFLYVRRRYAGSTRTTNVYHIQDCADEEERFLVAQAHDGSATVGLLHFSDLHGDANAAKLLIQKMDNYSDYINNAICTGDVVHWYAEGTSSYPEGYDWWKETGLAEKSLFVLGNHDGATTASTEYDDKDGTAAWDGKGREWAFDTYFADYISGLGCAMPAGYGDSESPYYKACYWHKDFADANLRVIGLDAIHRFDGVVNPSTGEIVSSGLKKLTAEQEEWLIARLNETLPGSGDSAAGYSVVVCGHYPLDDFSETTNGKNRTWNDGWVCNTNQNGGIAYDHKTGDITNWHFTTIKSIDSDRKYCYRNRVGTTSSWSKGTVNNIGDIIQNFKNNGGKFVAFLCGHFHSDMMFYPKSYPDLLNIAVTQAGWLRGGGSENKENLNCTRLSANYIGIDTATGHIKIVRLGSKANKYLAPLHYICYDYINKKIVNEG